MKDHTFIFSDLVGFTALTEANGDEHAAELALDFYERVRTMLPDHCAEEVKTIGDAMMLRCDDAEPAMRLGLRMVSGLEAVPGFPPVRVGMHTGPAVSRDGDWYGATVNVAARLCAAAGGGEVLVGESTLKAAGRMRKVQRRRPPAALAEERDRADPGPARQRASVPARPSFLRPLLPGARQVVSP